MAAEPGASNKKAPSRKRNEEASSLSLPPLLSHGALGQEAGGLVVLTLALALLLAMASFNPADLTGQAPPHNLIGPAGAVIGNGLLHVFGLGAFVIDGLMWYLGFVLLMGRTLEPRPLEILGYSIIVLSGAVLGHLVMFDYLVFGHLAGGIVGEFIAEFSRGIFGTVGTYIIAICTMTVSTMLLTQMSLGSLLRSVVQRFQETSQTIAMWREARAQGRTYRAASAKRVTAARTRQSRAHDKPAAAPIVALGEGEIDVDVDVDEEYDDAEQSDEFPSARHTGPSDSVGDRLRRLFGKPETAVATDATHLAHLEATAVRRTPDSTAVSRPQSKPLAAVSRASSRHNRIEPEEAESPDDFDAGSPSIVNRNPRTGPQVAVGRAARNAKPAADALGPQIVTSQASRIARDKQALLSSDANGVLFRPQKKGQYELPPLNFLNYDKPENVVIDRDMLREMAAQIEKTLRDFKVEGGIVEICPGPVITMFEFSPAAGVKISRIAGLADDLAMALSAKSVRIVAPIPGKGVVGIEVPNPEREMVYLKEIIADDAFQDSRKMILPLALGKDTEGGPIIADLARMPHLLVAGATGAGKSVAVNTMILSLLYKHTPDDVRMIMVDPKMLEFSIYRDIPHLLLPVVTDPKQATVALNWGVQEMERRYQKLADMGVRDIRGYNEKVEVLTKQAELDQLQGREASDAMRQLGIDADGNPEHKRLPYIIVVIDEFADLMMTASKDVELAVARLAQKARASGIHLILATQRPSTDVITGLIKANFPTRLALRVTSKTDSRVILDSNGAENLLGNGDMLFVPPGTSVLQRTHGAYVSEREIDKVVEFLRHQGTPQYDETILVEDKEETEPVVDDSEKDEHYREAVRLVVESRQASISMLQRKLRVGYNRAARMVEIMEMEGIVGPSDSCKPREVLMDHAPY